MSDFYRQFADAKASLEAATPVTIGLDVLNALIRIASPKSNADGIIINMASNAAEAAYNEANAIQPEASLRYETEGMSEIRRILTEGGISDNHTDAFKGCLSHLEQHGFKLMRDIDDKGTFAGLTIEEESARINNTLEPRS
jgi:hypothetical protein